jgi:tRNA A37 threonylcarbamoyladenosine synthetase subunit TsaC/SUA5/YrdC
MHITGPENLPHEALSAYDLSLSPDPMQTIARRAMDGLVVLDNGPVFGILSNARWEDLAGEVQRIKGEARDVSRPLGVTAPFDAPELADVYDTTHIEDPPVRKLLEDIDDLTEHLGGMAFVRARANTHTIDRLDLPYSIISRAHPDPRGCQQRYPEIQIYSPAGNALGSKIIKHMLDHNGLPVMTSANKTTEPEIIDAANAVDFAVQSKLPFYVAKADADKPVRPRSSYPIFQITNEGMRVIRTGFLDESILKSLVPRQVRLAFESAAPKHDSKHILKKEDLPRDLQNVRGPELRLGLLEIMGVR